MIELNEYDLECRPIHPEIHDKESRDWFKLPPCTCHFCNELGDNPLNWEGEGY
tara:strand:+ start:1015 stop:1173 length:159 start_codon:yes stop_codon:yes gene_type:complete